MLKLENGTIVRYVVIPADKREKLPNPLPAVPTLVPISLPMGSGKTRRTAIPDVWTVKECEVTFPVIRRLIVRPIHEAIVTVKREQGGRVYNLSPKDILRKMRVQFMSHGFPALYWSEFLRWQRQKPSMLFPHMVWTRDMYGKGILEFSEASQVKRLKAYSL